MLIKNGNKNIIFSLIFIIFILYYYDNANSVKALVNDKDLTYILDDKLESRNNKDNILLVYNPEDQYEILLTSELETEDLIIIKETKDIDIFLYGISLVDKVLKNEDNYYVLISGEEVAVKELNSEEYIIVDVENNEFIIEKDLIEIRDYTESIIEFEIPNKSSLITKLIKSAYNQLGKPYVYGDIGNRGFDCSGLIYSLYYNNLGIKLPRTSYEQVNIGKPIKKSELIPGDVVLFNTSGYRISHAGIYIGEGNMIHASSGKQKVTIDSIESRYFQNRYVTGRRILD